LVENNADDVDYVAGHISHDKVGQIGTADHDWVAHLRHPGGEKNDSEIRAGDIDQGKVYWSGDGTIYNGKLQMIWIGVESAHLTNLDCALATYSLEGTESQGYALGYGLSERRMELYIGALRYCWGVMSYI